MSDGGQAGLESDAPVRLTPPAASDAPARPTPPAASDAPARPTPSAAGAALPEDAPVSVSAATMISCSPPGAAGRDTPSESAPGPQDTHFGPACPSCSQLNHPGTLRCVFCGHVLGEPAAHGPQLSEPITGPASSRPAHIDLAPESAVSAVPASSLATSAALRRSNWSNSFDDIPLAVADPLIGVVVADRYRIVEGLGRGGMGIVYRVEHKQIGKLLAMKLLTGELSRNPEVVRRFKHEALTASRLSSPNTVQVFDFGVSDGLTYLVMELVSGEDLGRILRTHGPMPWSRLGKVIVQVCSSLAEAHGKGIVHRDIKPENIMLVRARDGSDIAKVLDFGLAKLRDGEGLSELTSAGAIVGTPYFMSPEQVRGDPVDARSDIYSLGALMYRALTGHYPFNGPTPMSVFTKHLTEVAVPPIDRAPELAIPSGVSRIVMKMLLKSPADRFQRIEDLQAAVVEQLRAVGTSSVDTLLDSGAVRKLETAQARAAAGTEIATRHEVERYERKLRRQRYTALGMLVCVLLGAGGIATKYFWSRKPTFTGMESEPNDVPGDANPVPTGSRISGYLGRRADITRGDRDFFEVDVPAPPGGGSLATTRLAVTALPNIAMCTMLYRPGLATSLGQYCVGRPGRDLVIPALRLEPGRYFVAVMQDMDPYGAQQPPFIYENVSDSYSVLLEPTERAPGVEAEPNDQVASAVYVGIEEKVTAVLGWARDADVFCVRAGAGERVRLRVNDTPRDTGAVLEVTPMRGTEEGAAVRVHLSGKNRASSSDVIAPWDSEPLQVETEFPHCVRVRLALDPWETPRGPAVPSGGTAPYSVEVLAGQ